MNEIQQRTPDQVKNILNRAQDTSRFETKHDPTLLAISALLDEGVRPNIIIEAFTLMGLSYGEEFVMEGSKYKYKKIRTLNPKVLNIPIQDHYPRS